VPTSKKKKNSNIDSSYKFEPGSMMNFQEIKLDVAIRILKDSGLNVSEEEASEILALAHTLAKITIKDFILNQDRFIFYCFKCIILIYKIAN
jgi:hypothetical protein